MAYLKEVKSGHYFRFVGGSTTVYKAVLVRVGISQTSVEYLIPASDYPLAPAMFTKPSLTSVVIVDTPETVV